MDQESVATTTGGGQNGAATPDAHEDGLVHLRRQSDWTGQPRVDADAAASAYRAALDVATATLTAYDGGTAAHSDDVVTLCLALAEELGVHDRERAYLLAAAELHDIGKVGVPPQILSKPGALDPDEWEIVREHTVTGERILGAVPELAEVARIVRHCHERWDGGGYPDGLAGERIPLAARIVFCADAFHAIRGDRPYRRGRSARAALTEVQMHSGTQFDPAVVKALATVADQLGERRRRGFSVYVGGRRSQRLAALLLTLAIGGAAMAATGVWGPTKGKASTEVSPEKTPAPAIVPDDPRPASSAARDRPTRKAVPAATKSRAVVAPAPRRKSGRGVANNAPSEKGRTRRRRGGEGAPGRATPERRRGRPTAPAPQPRAPAPQPLAPGTPAPAPAPAPAPGPAPAPLLPGDQDADDENYDSEDDDGLPGNGRPGKGRGNGYGHDKDRGGHRGHDH